MASTRDEHHRRGLEYEYPTYDDFSLLYFFPDTMLRLSGANLEDVPPAIRSERKNQA